jgi:hypothetical protein
MLTTFIRVRLAWLFIVYPLTKADEPAREQVRSRVVAVELVTQT